MRIYQADLSLDLILKYHELFPERKLNVLRSFGRLTSEEKAICLTHRDKLNSVILDSGTYSLNFAQKPIINITIDSYEAYLRHFGQDYDFYFNFDSDFSQEGFAVNIEHQRRLEKVGLKPVPVVHDIYEEEIQFYIDQGYETVAVALPKNAALIDLYMAIDRLHKAGIRVHLFGTSSYEYIARLPIFSCDSTTWTKAAAFGKILYWNPHKQAIDKTEEIYVEEYLHQDGKKRTYFSTYEQRQELEIHLATLDIKREDLYGANRHFYKQLINVDYFFRLEEWINTRPASSQVVPM
jgi:hypothetical protein